MKGIGEMENIALRSLGVSLVTSLRTVRSSIKSALAVSLFAYPLCSTAAFAA